MDMEQRGKLSCKGKAIKKCNDVKAGVEIVEEHFISELFLFTYLLSFGILQSSLPRSKCLGSYYYYIFLLLQGWIKYN